VDSYAIFILSVFAAYLIGSFPTSYIMGRLVKGIDVREAGSKNAGATNVLRTVGKIPALITLIVDILKGFLVVTVVADYFYSLDVPFVYEFYKPFLGFVAICGHIWPVWLKFRGGKGVAATLGVALGLAPLILLPSLVIWIAVFAWKKFVSLASILSLISFPIFACIFGCPVYTTIFSVAICAIVIYKHKENIRRLINGQENKTVIFK
jgi:acyl phosphate:glycerol-3-phosphate acyltransferase